MNYKKFIIRIGEWALACVIIIILITGVVGLAAIMSHYFL
jgi:hypothetical protein